MKKILFTLLCATCLMLIGCEKNGTDTPTQPSSDTEVNEKNFLVKFYSCDTLLKYCSYNITCSDSTIDCSKFHATHPDLTTSDSIDWEEIEGTLSLAESMNINLNNTQFITDTLHLRQGKYTFCLHYTYNGTPFSTSEVDLLMGGTYFSLNQGWAIGLSQDKTLHGGVETATFTQFLGIVNDYKITITVR